MKRLTNQPTERPTTHVLVLGAGYAGLLFTMRLVGKTSAKDVRITLVNDAPHFTERLRMHQFAANQTLTWRSLPRMLAKTHVAFVEGKATHIDVGGRAVTVETPAQTRTISFDYLVLAIGSLTDRDKIPGVADYAYTLAPRGPFSAAALREKLPALAQRGGRVVVVGGGPTGVESAAELASSYPRLKVHLVTEGRPGGAFGKGISEYMGRTLTRLGVQMHDEATVTAVGADGVTTAAGEAIPCDVCLWTGGFVAPALARDAGLAVNGHNQALVDPFMRALGHPEVYAVGDSAHPQEDPGVPVRMSAVTATILGAHGADCLSAILHGKMPHPLSFAYLGQGIALGRGNAIGFNNYPDDKPRHPYFTGWLGFQGREFFVRLLTDMPGYERRWPGFFYWPGKRRYLAARKHLAPTGGDQVSRNRTLDPVR